MSLLQANCELLQQGIELLARHDRRTFCAEDAASYGSGIGAHFRHVADHYHSFIAGVESGLVDYDNRKRRTAEESDRRLAIASLDELKRSLEALELDGKQALKVRVCASTQESSAHGSGSTVARELQFLVSHTVHHYALIAIASRMHGIFPDEAFGVAPSTLKYLESVGA